MSGSGGNRGKERRSADGDLGSLAGGGGVRARCMLLSPNIFASRVRGERSLRGEATSVHPLADAGWWPGALRSQWPS